MRGRPLVFKARPVRLARRASSRRPDLLAIVEDEPESGPPIRAIVRYEPVCRLSRQLSPSKAANTHLALAGRQPRMQPLARARSWLRREAPQVGWKPQDLQPANAGSVRSQSRAAAEVSRVVSIRAEHGPRQPRVLIRSQVESALLHELAVDVHSHSGRRRNRYASLTDLERRGNEMVA